ncbi:MAG TPA: translocation/assembly module TamB domain-containing protein, partial [Bacteroidia bacterium]|nr:translocation/assembly module TamB domain-containing protein [Bacteroidia bacterium]
SLLVLNRFSPPEGKNTSEESGSGNAVGQNLSEFVSQQLSNWASQLSDKFNIGVNYRPGDALNRDEFDVSIATELFRNRVAVESNVGVANNSNQTSSIIGDFQVEFKISKDGNLRAKAFNKTNTNNLINNLNSQYTQGIGVFYRKEFNTVSDLVESFRKRKKTTSPN